MNSPKKNWRYRRIHHRFYAEIVTDITIYPQIWEIVYFIRNMATSLSHHVIERMSGDPFNYIVHDQDYRLYSYTYCVSQND
jgi:hypothetical protein